jgi:hypothetical protein
MLTEYSVASQYMCTVCNDLDNWYVYHLQHLSFLKMLLKHLSRNGEMKREKEENFGLILIVASFPCPSYKLLL